MWILAKILALATFHDRYFPEIKWADKPSWTHNVFRVYEMIFGRRYGVKAEMEAVADPYGNVVYACHSWESVFAFTEQCIRGFLSSWKWIPFKVYIPVMQTPQGFPIFASPYIFAIAFDATATQYLLNSWSISFTCTGSNGLLTVGFNCTGATDPFSAITYNSVSLTAINPNNNYASTEWAYHYRLLSPSTGSNTLAITSFNTWGVALSYSGVSQSGFPDSTATGIGTTATTITATTTVVASNCWLSMTCPLWQANTGTAGAGTTIRGTQTNRAMFDSNGTVGTGAQSLVVTADINPVGSYYSIISIAPPSAGPTGVKTWDGVTQSSGIKTYESVAVASVKKVIGVA